MLKKNSTTKNIELFTWSIKKTNPLNPLGHDVTVCTAGFVVRESKTYVWVANSEGNSGYLDINRIPKNDIISRARF
ncbi:hypothetical protein IPJ70_03590 [Candidatus Campbellbacteria bacterium]|nr:MAG: hypothetical protein IPJ70_03590 [Candidatus Campbellbacteria bacterium]